MGRAIQHTAPWTGPFADSTTISETTPETAVEENVEVITEETTSSGDNSPQDGYRVILYDDDHHGMEEVAAQIHRATDYPPLQCWAIMLEAHNKGRAVCYRGSREKCQNVTKVLREIRLQCEVDCD